jgi:glycosyltransferase involved in cell wall biosynthesis
VTGKHYKGQLFQHPFHLLVDARCIGSTPTGVGTSLYRLLKGLHLHRKSEQHLKITVVINPQSFKKSSGVEWQQFEPFHLIEEKAQPSQHPGGDFFQQIKLPQLISRLNVQAIYSPAYLAPLYTGRASSYLMIHDDLIWSQPRSYPWSFRTYLSAMTRLSAKTANTIFFPSHDARKRCCQRLGIPKKKTTVLYHGVESFKVADFVPLDQRQPYVLCVANGEERKNHETLIRSVEGLSGVQVRFAGISPRAKERIASLSQMPGFKQCQILPPLSEEQLCEQYRQASALVLPSRGEGFGQPLIEAMNTGTPLLLSDIPVFHEIAQSAATFLDPDDVGSWQTEIFRAIHSPLEFQPFVQVGFQRGQKFSLFQTAQTFLKTIHDISGSS